jgi:hypothetical protein
MAKQHGDLLSLAFLDISVCHFKGCAGSGFFVLRVVWFWLFLFSDRRGWFFWFWIARVYAGIRDMTYHFKRCPCAGRHLLFFAAAKKSRQKKAAHTASACSYPRAPNVPKLHTAVPWSVLVASALNERLTRFEYPYLNQRQRMVYAAQVANCV